MSTSSISSSTNALAAQAVTGRRSGQHRAGLLETAAKTLGLSVDDLVDELRAGKSLDDVATAQGVSHADLAAAIKAGMPSRMADSANADTTVDAILSKKGMPERPQLPPAGPPTTSASTTPSTGSTGIASASGVLGTSLTNSQQATLTALSGLLGTDPDSLLNTLQSGTNLSDLLSAQNVDQSSLAAILQDGLLFDATV